MSRNALSGMKALYPLRTLIACAAILLPLLGTARGDTDPGAITLYLQPSEQAPVVGTVAADDPIITTATAVMDEDAAQLGWHWNERPGTYRGFIDPEQVRKDLLLADSTLVFLRPGPGSPVLATLGEGDEIEIVGKPSAYWVEIEFEHPVPVYFLGKPEGVATEAIEVAAVEAIDEPPVVAIEIVEAEIITTPDLALEAQSTQAGIPRYFQGILRSYRPGLFNFNPPPFIYQLETPRGTRIAFIDLRHTIVTGPIDKYLNQTVLILGTPQAVQGHRREIAVQVINLRTR